jgi:polyisoprenoid-binding protein YceI
MKTIFFTLAMIIMGTTSINAQKLYYTKNGHVDFFSATPMENIKADNNKVTSIMDITTGDIEFTMLIAAFQFEKALMQEHFNENYMESTKFPKASFKGKITNLEKINFTTDGTYAAQVDGNMTIHGVTKQISTKATFIVASGKITGASTFMIIPGDYNISIPNLVRDNIAKEIKVNIESRYEPYIK